MKKGIFRYLIFLFVLISATVFFVQYCFSTVSYKSYYKNDLEYKQKLVLSSKEPDYKVENLSSIMGPYEIEEFIRANDAYPEIYTPSESNVKNGVFRANFHAHTRNSDGKLRTVEYLELAKKYADKTPNKPFYIAITDHNRTITPKQIIDILQTNPNRYKNLKIALGMEVYSEMNPVPEVLKGKIHIHLLALGINPYDNELNRVFRDKHTSPWNYSSRSFDSAIVLMNRKGLIGIAHPARYITDENADNPKIYIDYLFKKYKKIAPCGLKFAEVYYQSYNKKENEINAYIKEKAPTEGIFRVGDIDNHNRSLFKK